MRGPGSRIGGTGVAAARCLSVQHAGERERERETDTHRRFSVETHSFELGRRESALRCRACPAPVKTLWESKLSQTMGAWVEPLGFRTSALMSGEDSCNRVRYINAAV